MINMFMIKVQNENEHILIQNPQSQTLPAAFDKQDKDQFVADYKEVNCFLVSSASLSLFSVPKHSFRELQEDLLVLLEVLPGMCTCTLYTPLMLSIPKHV